MPRDYEVFLEDVLEAIRKVRDYTDGLSLEAFAADAKTFDAVIRNLEIIGEAARRFDEAFRSAHPEIPWRAMTDVRNILIHAYDRVAAEILVGIVRQDVPPLLASVRGLIGDDQDDSQQASDPTR